MYEDQVLDYLQEIAENTGNIEVYTQSIMGDLVALRYELAEYQEINHSGDMIRNEEIKTTNSNTLLIAVILMTSLLFTFIIRSLK